ncbi:protein Ino4p [[Candida] jaroonii]|uniref:Protein Ino4p n=1 Tax=[Candida] jaroonii TaxID=467808 RepID=A0ACA9Y158_9ASCO|nr:protein Ino4p [[Candida] jaroonii]
MSEEKRKRQAKASVLSEEQKKAHHIASEQKRRENIRSEFDKIVSLTPTLNESENRSELNILTKSADYIDTLKSENEKLVALCRERGIAIPEDLIYTGPDDIQDLDLEESKIKGNI